MTTTLRSASLVLVIPVLLGPPSSTHAVELDPGPQPWRPIEVASGETGRTPVIQAQRLRLFSLDRERLEESIAGAVVPLPLPDGRLVRFRVVEAPVMVPSLAARLPRIRTYAGRSLDQPRTSVRFSSTPLGLHAQIRTPGGTVYVHPYWQGDATVYASYHGRDYPDSGPGSGCETVREIDGVSPSRAATSRAWGAELREYKFALVADAEFLQLNSTPGRCADGTTACDLDDDCAGVGGPCAPSLESRLEEAHIARVNLVNDINGFLEVEAGMRYVLVDDGPYHFTIAWSSEAPGYPFTHTTACSSRDDVQSALADLNAAGLLPYSSYDLGHLASGRWMGGCASSHVSCDGSTQGRGVSARGVPVAGDPWWIYLVRHESSHQLDAGHTYTGRDGSCTAGQMDSEAAVEPGAGSTFMSYDGFCRCDNIRDRSQAAAVVDDHYHSVNLDLLRIEGDDNDCWDPVATGNQPPSVDAGPDLKIPRGTPFYLDVASSGDPDTGDPDTGDVLTYVWEQIDLVTDSDDRRFLSDPDDGQIPLFRSIPPTTESRRYFPSLANLMTGYNPMSGEKLPQLSRNLTMRVIVRDNAAGGGGVAWDERKVTVHSGSGPFVVTSPGWFEQWQPGSRTVVWTVAGTDGSPLGVSDVRITLSADDGETFDQVLASSTPNDGSATVTIPDVAAFRARVMVEAIGGVFLAVSEPFLIGDCITDADCDDGLYCNGSETCSTGGACQTGTDPCGGGLCLERHDYCAGGDEGYVISRNEDFSTQDRTFYRNQHIHSLVWSDDLDYTDPDQHNYDLSASTTVTMNLCNRLDFTYDDAKRTRPGDLGDSTSQDWEWEVNLRDDGGSSYEPADDIQILDCTADPQCVDGLYCNGVEYCNEGTGWCFDGPDPCPVGMCNEATDSCLQCILNGDCDNGVFCDGVETCQAGLCLDGADPCIDPEHCDEETDECIDCLMPEAHLYIHEADRLNGRYTVLSFTDGNDPGRVTGYNVYRSTDPTLPHALWTLVASNVGDEDPVTSGIQWTDDSASGQSFYYQVAAYNDLCPGSTGEGPW